MLEKVRNWIDDRFALNLIRESVLNRRVPTSPWYYGDGATLSILLVVLVITGAFMTPSYSPHPDSAYDSVVYITEEQTLGWFIRALHYWCAGLMVVMVLFHLFRVILVGGYKASREGTWLTGVVMLALVFTMAYTGYILRWDERAIHGLRVALHMFYRVPLIGEYLVEFVQGGRELSARTLTRLYAVHVIFVPGLLLLLVAYHLYLVIARGVTSYRERRTPIHSAEEQKALYHAVEESEAESEVFHPHTTFKSGLMGYCVLATAVLLALFVGPATLMPEANLVERTMPQEEWWFWWYSGLAALLPRWAAPTFYWLFPVIVLLLLLGLPFYDRSPHRGMKKRPVAVTTVVVCIVALLLLSDYRRRSPFTAWPQSEPPPVPSHVQIGEEAERGRHLFVMHGCHNCHAIAGHGPGFAPDLARPDRRFSRDEIRNYILDPPEEWEMPSYRGRISEEDLEAVVGFVHVAQTFPVEQRE